MQIAVVGPAFLAYFLVRGITEGDVTSAVAHAHSLADFERGLGIYVEPRLNALIATSDALRTTANMVYMWAHWPLIFVVAIWLVWRHPATFRRCERAFSVSGAIGLTIFFLWPTAPPRLVGSDFVDTVTIYSQSYRLLQPPQLTNQYAAFPSLHVGWNLLIGLAIVAAASGKWARLFGALSPLAMALAAIATANHYVIDVLAGSLLAMAALAIVALAEDHFDRALPRDAGDDARAAGGSGRWRALARLAY